MKFYNLDKLKPKFGKLILVPLGDIHYGNKYCNLEKLKETIDFVMANDNAYVIGMGDLLEASIVGSPGASVYEQDCFTEEQYNYILELLKPLAKKGKIIGILESNHHFRIYKKTGFNITKAMCDALKVEFLEFSAALKIKVGNINYDVYVTHGSSGSKLTHTRIKSVMDLSRIVSADLYIQGHVHTIAHATDKHYKFNYKNKCLDSITRHYVISGSYLDYEGSYAELKNMTPSNIGTPKIYLNSKEKEITVKCD